MIPPIELGNLTVTHFVTHKNHPELLDTLVRQILSPAAPIPSPFTLPASPNAVESTGAGGVDGGFFIPGTFPISIDGQASSAFFSFILANLFYVNPGITSLSHPCQI
jgi:hypothetical protein